MRIQLLPLLLFISIIHSPPAVAAERDQQDSIQLFFAELVQAVNDRDFEAIGSSWTEEGQIFTHNGFRFGVLNRRRNRIALIRITPPDRRDENQPDT